MVYKTEQHNHWTLCAISKYDKVIKRQKKLWNNHKKEADQSIPNVHVTN